MSQTRFIRLALVAVAGLAVFAPLIPAGWQAPLPAAGAPSPAVVPSSGEVAPSYQEVDLGSAAGGASLAAASAAGTKTFEMVGVTWPYRANSARVVVKVRVLQNGKWTGWQQLPVEDEHGPDPAAQEGRPRSGTEAFWVGTANGVEAALTTLDGTTVRGAKVSLINPGTSPADNAPQTMSAAPATATATATAGAAPMVAAAASRAPYRAPAIISRRGWGADERLRGTNGAACARPKYSATVQAAFVHHTVDRNNYTRAQVPAMIRAIYAFHVKGRGWCDVGYNFLVDKFGRVFEGRYGGRQFPVLGAHTGGYNTDSFGISLIGNFQTGTPPAAMMEATARTIAWKLDSNYRSPIATVVLAGKRLATVSGHRDTKATACPGVYVYRDLGWLRQRVNTLMGRGTSTEIFRYVQTLGGYTKIGQPFWGEHPVRGGRATWFGGRDVYWSAATGPHSIFGWFRARSRQPGVLDVLGLPTGEERVGQVTGSRVQRFRSGALYWTKATGTQPVYGLISQKYGALGAERSRLGLPTRAAYRVNGGVQQTFQHGSITSSSRSGKVLVSYRAQP
jgi:hypothetical protein